MLVDRSVAWLTQKINVILFTIHTTCSKYVVCTNMVVHENPNQPIKAKGKKFLFKEKKNMETRYFTSLLNSSNIHIFSFSFIYALVK